MIQVGDLVKVRLWPGERIWVRVTHMDVDGPGMGGVLDNEPANPKYKYRDHVAFAKDAVLDALYEVRPGQWVPRQ